MSESSTVLYEVDDGVAWVTLNRPDAHNALSDEMADELIEVWGRVRHDDAVRVVVVTGAGERAFCAGIDRGDAIGDRYDGDRGGREPERYVTAWDFKDPAGALAPKAHKCWKPVIAAVNGIACGGAFYLLGDAEFIIAADHATFFDPHVTYGMTAAFEPTFMLQKMPFGEIMRMSLLGSHERMSAARAHQIGLVSEVVPGDQLMHRAGWAARTIADEHPHVIQGTVRALWAARELSRQQALDLCYLYSYIGTRPDIISAGQQRFAAGHRPQWRLR